MPNIGRGRAAEEGPLVPMVPGSHANYLDTGIAVLSNLPLCFRMSLCLDSQSVLVPSHIVCLNPGALLRYNHYLVIYEDSLAVQLDPSKNVQ